MMKMKLLDEEVLYILSRSATNIASDITRVLCSLTSNEQTLDRANITFLSEKFLGQVCVLCHWFK